MMLKYEQSELDELKSVDPRIIQPIVNYTVIDSAYNQLETEAENIVWSPADSESATLRQLDDYSIKMEQCINLNLLLSRMPEGSGEENTADELNTPIFDIPTKKLNIINIQDTTDTDVDRQKQNPFDFNCAAEEDGVQEIIVIGGEDYSENENKAETQTNSEDHSVVNNNSDLTDGGSMLPYDMSDVDINLDEYDLLSDCNEAMLLDVFGVERERDGTEYVNVSEDLQNDGEFKNEEMRLLNPESQNSVEETVSSIPYIDTPLKLNLSKFFEPTIDMQTPDVINTIFSIEKDHNPFTYGEIVKVEDILQLDDNSSSVAYSEAPSTSTVVTTRDESDEVSLEYKPPQPRNARKRKNLSDYEYDDGDEDYVPPGKRTKPKPERVAKRRGRPSISQPQHRTSVSSDNSSESSSKYREMRDKNNEASRRSRQKRRMQEQYSEKEKDELVQRNVQLKAQVSELERSVSTLRSDLMKLMLMKK